MPRRSKVEELKNLLADDTLSTAALVGSEEILRYAQDDIKNSSGEYLSTDPRKFYLKRGGNDTALRETALICYCRTSQDLSK